MYKFNYFTLINRTFASYSTFIRNEKIPICVKCLNFIEKKQYDPYEPTSNNTQYARCGKYGEIDFITGRIEFDLAVNVRLDDNKCGYTGAHYEERKQT
jgi:hypothetical protein